MVVDDSFEGTAAGEEVVQQGIDPPLIQRRGRIDEGGRQVTVTERTTGPFGDGR